MSKTTEKATHTPGPWRWVQCENGEGYDHTILVGSPDDWRSCNYYCFGWPEGGSFKSRGPLNTPGHEHNHAPEVLRGIGWHGSGDLAIEVDSPDARLIAAAPEMLETLRAIADAERDADRADPDGYRTHWSDIARRCMNLAGAAIAKALGKDATP